MRYIQASSRMHSLRLFLVILTLPSFAWSQEPQLALQQKLTAKLQSLLAQGGTPGATAGVALADGTVLSIVAGMADQDQKKPMTKDTLLLQGSVGKTYVAAVAIQLVQEKKLSLDEKVSKYLGEESWFSKLPNANDLTIRMLMNHTSGIMRYEFEKQFTEDLSRQPTKEWKPAELVSYILGKKPRFAAGQGWEYSDTNYIVLGMVIEKITGQTYHHELEERLLKPLGLKHTVASKGPKIPNLANGYAGKQNPFGGKDAMLDADGTMIINPQFEWTGGGVASTSADLARWAKLMYEGKAFDKSLLPTMLEGVKAPMLGRDVQYGLGVILRPTPLGKTYGHSGFFPGYMTEVMYWPESKVAVAVQVNTSEFQKVKPRLTQWCVELGGVVMDKK